MSDVLFDEVSRCRQEITRLTREIERLTLDGIHSCHAECQRPLCRLTRERDALLEALKKIAAIGNKMWGTDWEEIEEARGIARAAIAKAEGEQA